MPATAPRTPRHPAPHTRPPRRCHAGILATAVVAAAALAGACTPSAAATGNSREPLATLAAPSLSQLFDLTFWVREENAGTALWRQALAYCRRHPRLPNCSTVRIATWWGSPLPPLDTSIAAGALSAPAGAAAPATPGGPAAPASGGLRPPAPPAPPPAGRPAAATRRGAASAPPPPTPSHRQENP
jgi:hypothetical protein